jgi:prolyl-tRNA editing enzyme YbaK/EbsC (Cys-tRNA(Pro) deacylase)
LGTVGVADSRDGRRFVSAVHKNVQRVIDAGASVGVDVNPRHFPEGAKTAVDAANAIGCEVGQIVKSLVFGVDGRVVMAYVSGDNQLDESKLASAAGGERCERVNAEVVREATGFPIGGVPPFGHTTVLPVFVDPDLLRHVEVWAAAGTWNDVFPIDPAALVRASGGVVTELKRG